MFSRILVILNMFFRAFTLSSLNKEVLTDLNSLVRRQLRLVGATDHSSGFQFTLLIFEIVFNNFPVPGMQVAFI